MMHRWLIAALVASVAACTDSTPTPTSSPIDLTLLDGQHVFRFDTFGDEAFWTDTLKMHQVVQGVSPTTALAVGLKVDVDALPSTLVAQLKAHQVNLADPATTVALLKLNAVVGVNLETYTGEGGIPYWNAYVAVTQMHGHGNFVDPRTGDAVHYDPDLVTPKLSALQQYELSLTTPAAPADSFDAAAAARGQAVFFGAGQCSTCHVPPQYTDAGFGLHNPSEVCADSGLAARGTTGKYRTPPLHGLWQHPPYYHDGSLATLAYVVTHYNTCHTLGLTSGQQADLVQFLRSL